MSEKILVIGANGQIGTELVLALRGIYGAEQVIAFAHRTIVIGAAIASSEVEEPELRVERRRVPDRRAAALVVVGSGRPGVAADLAWAGQRVPAPQNIAGLGYKLGASVLMNDVCSAPKAIAQGKHHSLKRMLLSCNNFFYCRTTANAVARKAIEKN